jgi:hypothetical protein
MLFTGHTTNTEMAQSSVFQAGFLGTLGFRKGVSGIM